MPRVTITDEKSGGYKHNRKYFADLDYWAREHCPSYTGMHIEDVSDASGEWDEMADFTFDDEKDAFWFTTAWQS